MISERLVAIGPFIAPALAVILGGAALAACWLIGTGIRRRSLWRIALGLPVAGYLVAVAIGALA